ncbi:protein-glutamine gamma-glutamyltransferase 2-like protein [Leptotrombidium deliense]|uniref:Protein-glutamine gamma-glutamyltransferase 2-like protein n=1 Tax=Leptotrombidium deliense TaxID=299467 RepID=A0A443SIR0_9ACAR|nr:protein-glutamine gamma-glutamyltransferase 2-like protein [Leptotrombidium deliense]
MIDYILNEKGEKSNETQDSIWNYHVWSQAFMKRPDLSQSGIYDGWQDVDGTPQEKSGPKYQMGPTPVSAVKLGVVDAEYDMPFVYSEVNADVVWWKDGNVAYIETTRIGTAVLTKSIGNDVPMDITETYKPRDKTKDESETLARISQRLNINHPRFNDTIKQRRLKVKHVLIDIKCPDSLNYGDSLPISVTLKSMQWSAYAKNRAKQVQYSVSVKTMHYDGHVSQEVKSDAKSIMLLKRGKKLDINLNPEDYENSTDYDYILISVTVKDVKTDAVTVKEKEVLINLPDLKLLPKWKTADGRHIILEAIFRNPLTMTATNCILVIETQSGARMKIKFKELKPKQLVRKEVKFAVPTKNDDLLLSTFSCDQVEGSITQLKLKKRSEFTFRKH